MQQILECSLSQNIPSNFDQIHASIEDAEDDSDDDDDDSDDEGAYEETSLESYTTPLDDEDSPVDEYQVFLSAKYVCFC